MRKTISDIARLIASDKDKSQDTTFYAKVNSLIMNGDEVVGYKVSLDGSSTDTIDAKKVSGAKVGSVVQVTIHNGQASVTGTVGGDTDASDAQETADGSLASATVYYALSSSPTVAPQSGWSTTAPERIAGTYMWQKTVSTKNNGNVTETVTCIQGADGHDGQDGQDGQDGEDGTTYYTWIKYADNAQGGGISDNPAGKDYIGFSYNQESPIESSDPSDYTWSLIKGAQGSQGIPGEDGEDGQSLYTWIKYSDVLSPTTSSQIYDVPTSSTVSIGIAVNKVSQSESTNPSDYTWSRFKGDQGVPGTNGTNGTNGQDGKVIYCTSGSSESTTAKDAYIQSGTWPGLVVGVTISVKFTYGNTASSPRLDIYANGSWTGYYYIRTNGLNAAYWQAGQTVLLTFDGSYWNVASAPVYASTATIGNPASKNIYIDGSQITFQNGSDELAYISDGVISLDADTDDCTALEMGSSGGLEGENTSYLKLYANRRLWLSGGQLGAYIDCPLSGIKSSFARSSHTKTVSVAKGSYNSGTFTVSKASWYPLGVVGFGLTNDGGSGSTYGRVYSCRLTDPTTGSGTINWGIRASDGAVSDAGLVVHVLWVFNGE